MEFSVPRFHSKMKENNFKFFGSNWTAFALKFFSKQIANNATAIKTHSNGEKKNVRRNHFSGETHAKGEPQSKFGDEYKWSRRALVSQRLCAVEIFYKIFSALRPFAGISKITFRRKRTNTNDWNLCIFHFLNLIRDLALSLSVWINLLKHLHGISEREISDGRVDYVITTYSLNTYYILISSFAISLPRHAHWTNKITERIRDYSRCYCEQTAYSHIADWIDVCDNFTYLLISIIIRFDICGSPAKPERHKIPNTFAVDCGRCETHQTTAVAAATAATTNHHCHWLVPKPCVPNRWPSK